MKRLTVVTFDLDDTLWDVNAVLVGAERAMREWLADHAPACGPQLERTAWTDLRRAVLAAQPDISHNVTALRLAVLYEALTRAGYPETDARRLAQGAFDVFLDARHRIVFFDDALDVLETLARDYRIGALSNGNADVARLGLERVFTFKFSAADVGASKPAPEMFRAALAHTGVAPDQMVHVGDNPLDDIEGASRIGVPTVWANYHGREYPAEFTPPTLVLRRLRDLPELLQALRS
jgi:FMN hydrolase / 5-amino-6-(5-phospho-D-ribitylamino)uracil phosphatase